MRNKILTAIALATTVAAGAFAGYKIATDADLRGRLLRGAQDIVDTSKKKMDVMTEDVAMRTAQVTKNPKINQGWVILNRIKLSKRDSKGTKPRI